jgi:hypothetical protein
MVDAPNMPNARAAEIMLEGIKTCKEVSYRILVGSLPTV